MAGGRVVGRSGRSRHGGTAYTIPRLTVSLTRPLSSSSLSVSADSREVAAMRRPNARWDMKRSDTSSASVCMTLGITTFMYMLPSKDRMEASAGGNAQNTRGYHRVEYGLAVPQDATRGGATSPTSFFATNQRQLLSEFTCLQSTPSPVTTPPCWCWLRPLL